MKTEEISKKLKVLEAQLKQVSSYYIPPDKKSTSITPGTTNEVQRQWKEKRMEELQKEIDDITEGIGDENN